MLLDPVRDVGDVNVGRLDGVPDAAQPPLHVLKLILDGLQPLPLFTGNAVHLLVYGPHQLDDAPLREDIGANLVDNHLLETAGVEPRDALNKFLWFAG